MSAASSPADGADDATLVRRVLAGGDDGQAAANTLVRRYLGHAYSVAYSIVGRREDAEDVVQEAFVSALNALDRFDTSRPFAPWLSRIVANRALTDRRRVVNRATEELHEESTHAPDDPHVDAERSELRRRLRDALGTLPEVQQRVVQLAEVDGLTSAEIGEMLGMPAGTVRFQLFAARRALRRVLADLGPAMKEEA